MEHFVRKPLLSLVSGIALFLAACGGGGGSNNSAGGNSTPTAPSVKLTPTANSITVATALEVSVTVSGNSSTPTGAVKLTSGNYTSSSATLSGGTATISLPAATLPVGSNTLTASYTPDSASSGSYTSASGSAVIAVTVATPTVTVSPASSSIGTGQSLGVTVTVTGFSGGSTPTGSITLTSGSYSSPSITLNNAGSATIVISGGTLPAGNATLTASYSPDQASSGTYASASKTANVTVTSEITPTVSVSPASQSLTLDKTLSVTVKVNSTAGNPTPTGSVVLSSGPYHSSPTTLAGGSATVTVPGYSLLYGSATISAAYTADSASSGIYNGASGSATVSVARATPTVTVTPAKTSIDTSQALDVTVAVAGPGTGAPAATGSVTLTGGRYTTSSATALSNGSATVTIPAGALAAGNDTLTATYTPDTAGASLFNAVPGTSPAITVVIFSTVTVNQSVTLAPVTDQLMGMNLASWYDVVGNATSINAAFARAGIKAIRWPGGSWSDAWHWRTSATDLLPFMCITDPKNPSNWGGYSSFADFVTSIAKGGSYDLALTANYGSNAACNGGGDPAEAAGWAAEAVSEGYPPSHMTVGNENYGSWEFDLHANQHDPTTYADSVIGANGYYKLITKASAQTKVGVVVDAGDAHPGWDTTVLSLAKGSYDFVEYHYYPQSPPNENDAYLVHQAALDFTTTITKLRGELTAAGEPDTPIYIGEMSSVAGGTSPGKQSWSITQGLYAGQMLGEMMNDGISRATWWIGFGNCNGTAGNMSSSLYGWQPFGAYNVFSDADPNCPGEGPIGTMNPTAQAFNLFQNIAVSGENALGTTFSGDSHNIRVYAATHSGGTALFLFNLNQNLSQPVQIKLSGGSASTPDVQVLTYDKAIYDQTNAATPVWAAPKNTDMGAQSLPLTLNLTPWSMNVVIIQ